MASHKRACAFDPRAAGPTNTPRRGVTGVVTRAVNRTSNYGHTRLAAAVTAVTSNLFQHESSRNVAFVRTKPSFPGDACCERFKDYRKP